MSEYLYQVNIERSDIRERLHFLVCVLGPILEAHYLVAKFTLEELHTEQPGNTLIIFSSLKIESP